MHTILNPQETKVLRLLVVHQDSVVSYESIGAILWGAHAEEKFSLWAINKVISNIRKKLRQYGIPAHTLRTRSKQGYSYSSS
jgi:DNA-binding response OmpR family regulator